MKALLLNPNFSGLKEVNIDSFRDILFHLECEVFDTAYRQIGLHQHHTYLIYCDDEGRLKHNPKLTAHSPDKRASLYGNLIISKCGKGGDMAAITQEDIDYITKYYGVFCDTKTGKLYNLLFPIFYPDRY